MIYECLSGEGDLYDNAEIFVEGAGHFGLFKILLKIFNNFNFFQFLKIYFNLYQNSMHSSVPPLE
jgi:hypothetical protein